jgi:hypothetical protein
MMIQSSFATDKLQEFHSCFPDLLGGINQWVLWTTSYLTVKRCNKAGFLLSLTSKMKVIGKSSLILRSHKKWGSWSPPVEVPLFFHVFPVWFPQTIWDHWQHVATTRVAAIRQDSAVAFATSGEPNSEEFGEISGRCCWYFPSTYHLVLTHIAMENGWTWPICCR